MSSINLVNLIIWLEKKLIINQDKKSDKFNAKEKSLQMSWKYIILIFLKGLHNLICKQKKLNENEMIA